MWDMTGSPVASLAIGIASSPEDRKRLAQLLGGTEAFLIVSSVDQARHFLNVVETSGAVPAAQPEPPIAAAPVPPALSVDSDRRVLRWQDREVGLTPLEHDFMQCLVGAPGEIWTYQRLHLAVWGNEHLGRGSDIHSVVRRARGKLALLDASATIQAVRGVGLRLAAPAA
jgi:hypothetical protein